MDAKGQVSAEFLLLFLILLIVFTSVTIPLIGTSIDASMDVSKAADAKNALIEISKAVNIVYANGPGAKRTVSVNIPQNTNLVYSNNMLGMNVVLSNGTNKLVTVPVDTNVTITKPSLTQGTKIFTIYWNQGSSSVTIS